MPILKVLINEKGDVVGTARTDYAVSGEGSPAQVNVVARANQRIIEIEVDDKVARLHPAALHATIKAQHLHASKKSSAKRKAKR